MADLLKELADVLGIKEVKKETPYSRIGSRLSQFPHLFGGIRCKQPLMQMNEKTTTRTDSSL